MEIGFVNEHVTFTDEESDHDDERLVISTFLYIGFELVMYRREQI